MIERTKDSNGVEGMLTIKTAAKRCGVSPRRMHQLVKSRNLKVTRVDMGEACVFLLDPKEVASLAKEDRKPGRPFKKTSKSD